MPRAITEDEVAEVVASHLVEAYRLDPDAADAPELRERARRALIAGAERAAALGANEEAARFFAQAADLASSPSEEAAALTRAGEMVHLLGRTDEAEGLYRRASDLYVELGETHAVARLAAMLGYVALTNGRSEEAERVMREAYETVKDDEPDADVALLSGRLAQLYAFTGDARAAELVDRTLDIAEGLQLYEAMLRGWGAKAVMLFPTRPTEAFGLFMLALSVAREHDITRSMAVAYGNVNDAAMQRDLYRDCLGYLEEALPLARRIGDRRNEWFMLAEQSYVLSMLGRWDEAVARAAELPAEFVGTDIVSASVLTGVAGDLPSAWRACRRRRSFSGGSTISRDRTTCRCTAPCSERPRLSGSPRAGYARRWRPRSARSKAGRHSASGLKTSSRGTATGSKRRSRSVTSTLRTGCCGSSRRLRSGCVLPISPRSRSGSVRASRATRPRPIGSSRPPPPASLRSTSRSRRRSSGSSTPSGCVGSAGPTRPISCSPRARDVRARGRLRATPWLERASTAETVAVD